MDFFKKNKDITIGLVVSLLVSGWLFWQVLSVSGDIEDTVAELEEGKEQVGELMEKEFIVSEANAEVVQQNIKKLKANVEDLKVELKKYNFNIPQSMQIAAYTTQRDDDIEQMKKSIAAKKIVVASKFSEVSLKGLKDNTKPSAEDIRKGLYKLAVMKEIVKQLPEPTVSLMESSMIKSIKHFGWHKDLFVDSAKGDVRYIPFEIQVVGDEAAVRKFMNGVCSSDKLFATVRAVEYKNPVTFGLQKKDQKNATPKASVVGADGKPVVTETKEYKDERQVVNNNEVDWKIYFDFIQINEKTAVAAE
jgi:hypothetical protein